MAPRLKDDRREKQPTSVRVTPTCKRLWDELARRAGLSNAGVLEVMVREKAKAEGIELPNEQQQAANAA